MDDDDIAVVYSKEDCPWCHKASELLKEEGFLVKEFVLGVDYTKEQLIAKMINENYTVPKVLTLPQIYIENQLVGDYDQLYAYFNPPDCFDFIDIGNTK